MSQFDDFLPPNLRRPANVPLPIAPGVPVAAPAALPTVAGVRPIAVCGVCQGELFSHSTILKDCNRPRPIIGGTRPDQCCPLHDPQWKARLGLDVAEPVTEVTAKRDEGFIV